MDEVEFMEENSEEEAEKVTFKTDPYTKRTIVALLRHIGHRDPLGDFRAGVHKQYSNQSICVGCHKNDPYAGLGDESEWTKMFEYYRDNIHSGGEFHVCITMEKTYNKLLEKSNKYKGLHPPSSPSSTSTSTEGGLTFNALQIFYHMNEHITCPEISIKKHTAAMDRIIRHLVTNQTYLSNGRVYEGTVRVLGILYGRRRELGSMATAGDVVRNNSGRKRSRGITKHTSSFSSTNRMPQ